MTTLQPTLEDQLDRAYQWSAFCLLSVGLALATSAVLIATPEDSFIHSFSSWLRIGFIVICLSLAAITIWHSVHLPRGSRWLMKQGYVYSSVLNAVGISWLITWAFIGFGGEFLEDVEFGSKFILRLTGAVMTITASVGYLYLSFRDGAINESD